MKKLREGVSTGSCMTGGAEASVIWQTTGKGGYPNRENTLS